MTYLTDCTYPWLPLRLTRPVLAVGTTRNGSRYPRHNAPRSTFFYQRHAISNRRVSVMQALTGIWELRSWSAVWAVEFEGSSDEFLYQAPTTPLPAADDAGEVRGSRLSIG